MHKTSPLFLLGFKDATCAADFTLRDDLVTGDVLVDQCVKSGIFLGLDRTTPEREFFKDLRGDCMSVTQ
jgi:hypothetical protein